MKTFVVYEIWTRSRMVVAESQDAALENNEPMPMRADLNLHLANWYAVEASELPRAGGAVDRGLRIVAD